jgi:hypothetical protein
LRSGRQREAVGPANEGAGLEEAGSAQRVQGQEEARAEADAVGDLVRLRLERGVEPDAGRSDGDLVAGLEVEPSEQRRVDDAAKGAVALGQELGGGALRTGFELADGRVGAVHRLDLDQRGAGLGAGHDRHGAERGDGGDPSPRGKEGPLRLARFAVNQAEGHVAAEDLSALLRQALGERARDGGHAGDGGHPERDAGEEDAEAPQAPAQLAERQAQEERQARA